MVSAGMEWVMCMSSYQGTFWEQSHDKTSRENSECFVDFEDFIAQPVS